MHLNRTHMCLKKIIGGRHNVKCEMWQKKELNNYVAESNLLIKSFSNKIKYIINLSKKNVRKQISPKQ